MQTQVKVNVDAVAGRMAALEAELTAVKAERDELRASRDRLLLEVTLLRRRIFVAKAERVDTAQLELEFKEKLEALDKLSGLSGMPEPRTQGTQPRSPRQKPTGRRDLRKALLEEERVEISDELYEGLVAQGKAKRVGFEESCKIAYQRGGLRRLVIARVKYQAFDSRGETAIETSPMPAETFERSLAAPSMLARVATEKHCDGLPLFRIEDRLARDGLRVDRGTMCRWLEDLGATLGTTVVRAAWAEALQTAFCLATDATGVAVQPEPSPDGKRQACRRGHYFVVIADRDHIFFHYTPRETSAVVAEMLGCYAGYIQADAKSVYDILFREPDDPPPDFESERIEVGCWSHARTKFWEAAVAKSVAAREGLARIGRIFAVDRQFKGKPPDAIKRLRNLHLRPHLEAFFTWAAEQYSLVEGERGYLRTALGYVVRQKVPLTRVLDDGRLVLDNNRSERELRRIAIGRKAWLFVGSDAHASCAGHLFSMIASARLHRLDPETYLRDIIRVLAHWPKDRYIELAPKYWAATRERLNPAELAKEIGYLTVPPPLDVPPALKIP